MLQVLKLVLETDKKCRVVGIQDDLFRLSELKQQNWDYSYPTLTKENNVFLKSSIKSTSEKQVKQTFFENYPELQRVNWENLLIAGGSIGSLVYGSSRSSGEESDVDIFIYGLDE